MAPVERPVAPCRRWLRLRPWPFLRPYRRFRQRLDLRSCSRQCPGSCDLTAITSEPRTSVSGLHAAPVPRLPESRARDSRAAWLADAELAHQTGSSTDAVDQELRHGARGASQARVDPNRLASRPAIAGQDGSRRARAISRQMVARLTENSSASCAIVWSPA
jgi:hypothetical protein